MADTKPTSTAPANADPTPEAGTGRSAPRRAGKVAGIPKTTKNSFWAVEVESLRKEPGDTYKYEDVSQTTASYLRATYGVEAVTRGNTAEGRADLYVQYPAKAGADGRPVPDEDKVKEIKARYVKDESGMTPNQKATKANANSTAKSDSK